MSRRSGIKIALLVAVLLLLSLSTGCNQSSQPSATPAEQQSASPAAATGSTSSATVPSGTVLIDFSDETVGEEPTSFVPAVGYWEIGVDGDAQVLVVDGSRWSQGNTSSNIAEQARALYGDRYAEFLDNVQAYAYYPFAVAKDIEDFGDGEITVRFKNVEGEIDQNAGILFGLQPNGDYYAFRDSTLEGNLVLWQVVQGERSSLEWIRNTPGKTGEWHELKVIIDGTKVEGYLDGELYMTHTLDSPPTGKVGAWSKSDSVAYFDDFTVTPAQ